MVSLKSLSKDDTVASRALQTVIKRNFLVFVFPLPALCILLQLHQDPLSVSYFGDANFLVQSAIRYGTHGFHLSQHSFVVVIAAFSEVHEVLLQMDLAQSCLQVSLQDIWFWWLLLCIATTKHVFFDVPWVAVHLYPSGHRVYLPLQVAQNASSVSWLIHSNAFQHLAIQNTFLEHVY